MSYVTVLKVLFISVVSVRGFHNEPNCGENFYRNSKIIGGEEVREAEFPWYVSIKETGQHECGGFIINHRAVLTAAHCFKDFSERATNSPKTISVTLAAHYLSRRRLKRSHKTNGTKYPKGKWEQDVKVKRIIRHPYYDAFSNLGFRNDIAILLLEDKVEWNYGTRPVCLPTLPNKLNNSSGEDLKATLKSPRNENLTEDVKNPYHLDNDFLSGDSAIVAGWASVTDLEDETSLHKVRLTLYNNEDCKQLLKDKNVTFKFDIDSSVICAGSPEIGYDTCSGDSGSALLVRRGKKWVAIGIVSAGFAECGSGRPALYTRISSFVSWISSFIPK